MATRTNPFQFLQQVRAEIAKVVWPSRRETILTSIMVLLMAALTSAFFFMIDSLIRTALHLVLVAFN